MDVKRQCQHKRRKDNEQCTRTAVQYSIHCGRHVKVREVKSLAQTGHFTDAIRSLVTTTRLRDYTSNRFVQLHADGSAAVARRKPRRRKQRKDDTTDEEDDASTEPSQPPTPEAEEPDDLYELDINDPVFTESDLPPKKRQSMRDMATSP